MSNDRSDSKPEKNKRKKEIWTFIKILCVMVFVGLYVFLSFFNARNLSILKLLFIATTTSTFFIAVMTYFESIKKGIIAKDDNSKDDNSINIVFINILALLITGALCICFTIFEGWLIELILLLSLFTIFIIWDHIMLYYFQSDQVYKNELLNGHKYVNKPTFLALLIILCFFLIYSFIEHNSINNRKVELPKEYYKELSYDNIKLTIKICLPNSNASIKNWQDYLVSGLVLFHLLFGTIGYVSTKSKR